MAARFLREAAQPISTVSKFSRQNFDCDITSDGLVVRAMDLVHPARAKWGDNLVKTKSSFGSNGHGGCPCED